MEDWAWVFDQTDLDNYAATGEVRCHYAHQIVAVLGPIPNSLCFSNCLKPRIYCRTLCRSLYAETVSLLVEIVPKQISLSLVSQ